MSSSIWLAHLERVTVVDLAGSVLLDELVRPWASVADYLTKHSGITQHLLADVHTRIEQVMIVRVVEVVLLVIVVVIVVQQRQERKKVRAFIWSGG